MCSSPWFSSSQLQIRNFARVLNSGTRAGGEFDLRRYGMLAALILLSVLSSNLGFVFVFFLHTVS